MPRHRIGTYNVEFGHPANQHAQMIVKRFFDYDLDVLAIQEAQDYLDALAFLATTRGFRLVAIRRSRNGANHVAFLVNKRCRVGYHWSFLAATVHYFSSRGLNMAPQRPLAVYVDGLIYVNIHAPVEAWTTHHNGRRLDGPARRVLAYRQFIARAILLFRRHAKTPVTMLGDWNCTPDAQGSASPFALKSAVGGRYIRPHGSTGHGEIDFGICTNLAVESCKVEPDPSGEQSDHRLVVATVTTIGV